MRRVCSAVMGGGDQRDQGVRVRTPGRTRRHDVMRARAATRVDLLSALG
jgi:hypothetical protein